MATALPVFALPNPSVSDLRFIKYVSVSLRRYSACWRQNLRRLYIREALLLSQPIRDDEGGEVDAIDRLAVASTPAEDEYLRLLPIKEALTDLALFQSLQRLTPHQRFVLEQIVVQGEAQHVVASRLRITQQAVGRTKQQALRRLRAANPGYEVQWGTN